MLTVYLFVYKSSSFLDVKLFCMRASYYWPLFVVETYSTKKLGALLLLLFVYKSGSVCLCLNLTCKLRHLYAPFFVTNYTSSISLSICSLYFLNYFLTSQILATLRGVHPMLSVCLSQGPSQCVCVRANVGWCMTQYAAQIAKATSICAPFN